TGQRPDAGPEEAGSPRSHVAVGVLGPRVTLEVSIDNAPASLPGEIAGRIRERGVVQTNDRGEALWAAPGRALRQPGLFPGVHAWSVATSELAIGLEIDPEQATTWRVLETLRMLVRESGGQPRGCSLLGLIPEAVLVQAGRHAAAWGGGVLASSERTRAGAELLGLGADFDLQRHVRERRMRAVGLALD
ncbi:MAG: hypothetical protein QGG40_11340, partial [Myxococcota bacterium]|nr:hypothetical protein [Myxococcota bacterium]